MEVHNYGDKNSSNVIVQLVGQHELDFIESEIAYLNEKTGHDFCLLTFIVEDWNRDLSPWKAKAVFKGEDFGEGARETLEEILLFLSDRDKNYYLCGYSLAGLFALWASFKTDIFTGIAAVSPSVWFPGFIDYMKERQIKADKVYLSLGDKEEKTKNPIMSTVGDCIREAEEIVKSQGAKTTLEWNEGNHFRDVDIRVSKGIAWLLN